MRCVACNEPLSSFDITLKKPNSTEPEDMCYSCRGALDIAQAPGFDPKFKQFEFTKINVDSFKVDHE